MDNSTLAHNYNNGAEKGKGSHIFIDGDTIFSYGYHFPIARKLKENVYLFNSEGYSLTTEKHKGIVESALISKTLIYISECKTENANKQIETNKERIKEIEGKIERARKVNIKQDYKERIKDLLNQNKLLRELV